MKADRPSSVIRSPLSLLKKARREVVSWAAILLLAVNVLASGALPAQPISLSSDNAVGLLAQAMEICSDHGVDQQSSGQPSNHDGHGLHCVFCLPLLHGGLALPDGVAAVEKPAEAKGRAVFVGEQQHFVPARFLSSISPRAPPFLT